MELDRADLTLLALLQRDGRATVQSLSEAIHLSARATLNRVRRLEEQGVIEGYRALVSRTAVAGQVSVFAEIALVGQVREFQLRIRLKFKVRTPQGKELIAETELLQQRDISFNESAVLAKEQEEALLYRDMQTDLVQQLMRRLAAIKAL